MELPDHYFIGREQDKRFPFSHPAPEFSGGWCVPASASDRDRLMFGGIFSICDGYFNYWSELADVLKFVSLLVAFGWLIFLGYRRLERKEIAT